MRTIDRYILKELALTFLLGIIALNFVMMSERVLWLTRVLGAVGISLGDIAQAVLLIQPQVTVLTTPMALLVAVLLTYGRLNADGELTVLRAAGMPFSAIARPVFVLGALAFAASAMLSFSAAPSGAARLSRLLAGVVAKRAPSAIEAGIFNTLFKDVVLYVREKPAPDSFGGIFMYDERRKDRPVVLYAREGTVRADPTGDDTIAFSLGEGRIHFLNGDVATTIAFDSYAMRFPIGLKSPTRPHVELLPMELLERARQGREKDRIKLYLEFERRLSLPALCLVLAFLGPPLALMAGKTGRLGGLTIGLSVFAVYYAALMYAEGLARAALIPHYMGAWGPVLVLGAVSFWAFMRAARR